MNPTAVYTVVFSPTGTSKKSPRRLRRERPGTAELQDNAAAGADAGTNAAAGSAAKAFTTIDLTHAAGKSVTLPADAAAVFAVPVYGGRVAPAALERLQEIRGEGTPAVVLAVYGNRAFGTAVAQLAAFVAERGFVPVAAGAFVGEHSYSTPGTPIAEGRPDTQDLAEATAFGARIGQKLAHGETRPIDAAKLREPHTPLLSKLRFIRFVLGYRRRQKRNPVVLLPAGTTPHGAPNAAAASRSVPRRRSRAATNCTPTRRAASAAVHASKAARSAHARSKHLSPPFCRATSPGANHP